MKDLICIMCPKGCHLKVDEEHGYTVTGNRCPRGAEYGHNELKNPTRVITSTVRLRSKSACRLPVKTDGQIPKYMMKEAMRDEFFGGYNMYRNAERYGENLKTFYVGNTNIMKEDDKKRILKKYDPDVLPIELARGIYEETEGLDPLTKMSDVDIQIWLEGDIYLNVDKMSLAAGLEIRMPLTDRRIFDIASRMPSEYKVNEEQNKVALRTAAAKVLPEEIAFRKKLGFIVPIRIWMADDRYNADVRRLFASDIAEKFFHVEEIRAIFDEYVGGNSDNWRKVWTIYTFLVWYEEYFVKR